MLSQESQAIYTAVRVSTLGQTEPLGGIRGLGEGFMVFNVLTFWLKRSPRWYYGLWLMNIWNGAQDLERWFVIFTEQSQCEQKPGFFNSSFLVLFGFLNSLWSKQSQS